MDSKCFLGALVVVFAGVWVVEGWGNEWKVGAAKVVITPEKPMWMAGYGGRNKPAEGKLSDLYAKALVITDPDGHRGVVLTLDLVGVDGDISKSFCRRLNESFGLSRREIVICTSHTHSGPVVAKNLGPIHFYLVDGTQQELIREYAQFLERKVVEVVSEAIKAAEPATLSWGGGTASFAVNRRNNPEKDVAQLREENKLKGPVDHDVPVLAVKNASGKLTAVLFGYACHATVLSGYEWCADWPGYAQSTFEEAHPGCVALFWAGCGADQNPLPRRTVELAKGYGKQLAVAVEKVLEKELTPIRGRLSTTYREVPLPFAELPTPAQIEKDAASNVPYVAARAKHLLAQVKEQKTLSPTYPYPVSLWRLGEDVQFIHLGGEVVVDYSLRLKTELRGTKTWVAGYSHDVMAYIPSLRVLKEGGYEGAGAMVYYGQPTTWSPEVEKTIIGEVHAQVRGE